MSSVAPIYTGNTLTQDQDQAQLARLRDLAERSDDEINTTDIPPLTEDFWRNAVHGPWTPREPHTVTLHIDAEVATWLETNAKSSSYLINLLLKREAQRDTKNHVQGGVASQKSQRMSKAS